MLKSKTAPRSYNKKVDWFPNKTYVHLDGPLTRKAAEKLVSDKHSVLEHRFLPLMSFEKRERKYRRDKITKTPKISYKIRRLVYCSNKDSYIFAYYADKLNIAYESYIQTIGIEKNVIGYRKVGSNIELARSAFSEIRTRGACVAFAFDISGFFDNISHEVLKKNWAKILGASELPDHHYYVFRNLTKFSTLDRRACLRRLGFKPSARDKDLPRGPLCSIQDFRQKIRGDNGLPNLVSTWKRGYRIPQGTAMSALAANISMIDFDVRIRDFVEKIGGSYRRYSDDILVIIPSNKRQFVKPEITKALKETTQRLSIKDEKTHEIEFIPGALAHGRGSKPLQYLGFIFDGNKSFLRPNTISKFYRRMFRSIGTAKKKEKEARKGLILGRETLYRRKLLTKYSNLGIGNFLSSYAHSAKSSLPGSGIGAQVHRHQKILRQKTSS